MRQPQKRPKHCKRCPLHHAQTNNCVRFGKSAPKAVGQCRLLPLLSGVKK